MTLHEKALELGREVEALQRQIFSAWLTSGAHWNMGFAEREAGHAKMHMISVEVYLRDCGIEYQPPQPEGAADEPA